MNRNKLKDYFDNKLSAQEQLEMQMWLAEQSEDPETEAQLSELFQSLHAENDRAADAAFRRVSRKLGIDAAERNNLTHRKWLTYAQRAAAVLILPLLCALWLLLANRTPEVEWIEQNVPNGEVAELTLPDGTRLHLNSGSRITYPTVFVGKQRRVFIDGEVYAEVTKNPHRPFIIQSGEIGIKVLGTKFNFKSYKNTECVEVLLVEGAVQFDVQSPSRTQQLVMKPGDLIQYDRTTGDIDLSTFSPDHFKSFADNRAIHFFNLRMRDIASDLERLFGTQIVILDERLAETRYFAYFTNNENLSQILDAVNADHRMRIIQRDGVVYLASQK